jgi:V8-like Glu-specific endopeptidase
MNPEADILPIFVADYAYEQPAPVAHEGTGFMVGKSVFVTCWHCVRAELEGDLAYAATRKLPNGQYVLSRLFDIQQDPTGTDLATARVAFETEMRLTIAANPVPSYGTDIWSFGYPLTDVQAHPEMPIRKGFLLNGRYMQSYVMRTFYNDWPGFGRVPSYEIDMPALAGMSGAPIVRTGSTEVIGVLYGRNDAETIEEFGSRDPDTEERLTPEIVRITYFAAAHFTNTLRNLKGKVTNGQPLAEYLHS